MKDWVTKGLPEVLFIQEGPGIRKYEYEEGGYPMINVRCVQDGYIDMSKSRSANYELATNKWKHFQVDEGDILYTISGTIGRSAIVKDSDLPLLMNTSVVRFKSLTSELDHKFVYYFFKTQNFISELLGHSTGTAIQNVGPSHLARMTISFPPIPEQQRIVAILDQAFAGIEKARANAEKNLKNARELFDSYLNQVFNQRGEGWENKVWGDLCTFVRGPFGGSLKKSMFKESGYTVFEQKHAIHDHIEQFRYFIDEDKFLEMSRFEVKPGEMIMSCSGVTLGRVSVIPDGAPQGIINQALLKLSPKEGTDIHFIKYWIRSPIFQNIIFKDSGGAAQPNVPAAKQLKEISLSIPSIEQQCIVVNKIESFLETNRELIKIYKTKLNSLDELKKSLLQKAFSGELTKTEGIAA